MFISEEFESGFIAFRVFSADQAAVAMCSGVKPTECNPQHVSPAFVSICQWFCSSACLISVFCSIVLVEEGFSRSISSVETSPLWSEHLKTSLNPPRCSSIVNVKHQTSARASLSKSQAELNSACTKLFKYHFLFDV